jgi:PKD repeat protein
LNDVKDKLFFQTNHVKLFSTFTPNYFTMKKLLPIIALCFALSKHTPAQIICIFCYDQNDSISTGVNNLLLNGGFEAPSCTTGSFCPSSSYYQCNIPNWTCTGGGTSTYAQVIDITGTAWYGSFLSEVIEGTYAIYMGNYYCQACSQTANDTSCLTWVDCTAGGVPAGYPINPDPTYGGATGVSIEQTVSGLIVGNTYILEFWAGGEYDAQGPEGLFAVDVGFGNTFLRDKETDWGMMGTRYIIEFNAVSTSHTIKFTNWGHICSSCTELVLDDVRLYTLAELNPIVPPCAGSVPNAIFTAPNHICPGSCTNFTNLSSGATMYEWIFPGAIPSSSTDANPQNICYNTPGQYSVTLIAGNGTLYDTLTLTNYITVYPQPTAPTFTQVGDTLFSSTGYSSYQWFFGSDSIQGATNYFYVATQSGNYNIVVTDDNGCAVGAGIVNVIASSHSSLVIRHWEVNPNPFSDKINLQITSSQNEKAEVKIFNSMGEIIWKENLTLKQGLNSFSFGEGWGEALTQGIYFLTVQTGKEFYSEKMAKY